MRTVCRQKKKEAISAEAKRVGYPLKIPSYSSSTHSSTSRPVCLHYMHSSLRKKTHFQGLIHLSQKLILHPCNHSFKLYVIPDLHRFKAEGK